MTMNKTYLGNNPDGTPHFHYETDGHALITGKVYGNFTMEDGTVYDVSDPVIEIDPKHAGEIAHKIGVHHEENGHPDHKEGEPFVHECTDHCGDLKRDEA
jgi:hypothetical protein